MPNYLLVPLDPIIDIDTNPDCPISGFCVAYAIKYGYDTILGRNVDLSDIRKFAHRIEEVIGPLDSNNPDIEYGLFDGRAGGALLGGLGGAAIGTIVTGGSPAGALTGALIGGTAGYLLSND